MTDMTTAQGIAAQFRDAAAEAAGLGALGALTAAWGEWYEITRDDAGGWLWRRRGGLGGWQYAPGPDQASRDIAADYDLHPAGGRLR